MTNFKVGDIVIGKDYYYGVTNADTRCKVITEPNAYDMVIQIVEPNHRDFKRKFTVDPSKFTLFNKNILKNVIDHIGGLENGQK